MPLDDENAELRVKLSSKAAADMHNLAEEHGYSVQELLHFGLAFVHFALTEQKKKHKIVLIDENGERLKDIVILPSSGVRRSPPQKILDEHRSSSLARSIADLDPDRLKLR